MKIEIRRVRNGVVLRVEPHYFCTTLWAFLEGMPACVAVVLAYNGKEAVKLDEGLFAIPWGKLVE